MNQPTTEQAVLQDAWMRRIARALVRDAHSAEDLAQDAWVAALKQGRVGASDRPWLGGMMRHRVFSIRRKRATRLEREQAIALGESSMAADEVAAQLQLRELVSRELADLQEPYLTAVYLHCVEGMTVRQVAEKLGVAASTAHSRVQRGVERLRQRLDDAYGGDRNAWLGLIAPWGGAAGAATAWSAGLGLGLGLVALSAAVVASVLIVTWPESAASVNEIEATSPKQGGSLAVTLPTAAGTSGRSPGESVDIAMGNVTTAPAPEAAPPSTALVTEQEQDQEVVIRGSWSEPDGAAAVGATWVLKASSRNQHLVKSYGVPSDWEDLEGTLGADGILELEFEPHPSQQYSLTLDHPNYVPMTWRWGSLKNDVVKDLGDITLQVPGQIHGRLVDPLGRSLGFRPWRILARAVARSSGEGLQAVSAWTETDEDAAFVFDRLPAGPIQLELQDRNLGWAHGPAVTVTADGTNVIEFPFTRPDRLEDRVLLTCDVLLRSLMDPVRPEQLELVGVAGDRFPAVRDPEYPEAYVFDGLGDGDYRLELDDSRLTLLGASKVRRGQSVQCLVMGNATAQFSVTEPGGATIDDFSVELRLVSPGQETRSCTVRRVGSMLKGGRLRGLIPGDYEMTVRSGLLVASTTELAVSAGETRAVAVTLARGRQLSGRVLRPDGTPASNQSVRLVTPAPMGDRPGLRILDGQMWSSNPELFRKQASATHTDETGAYSLSLVDEPFLIVVAGDFPGPMAESAAFAPEPSSTPQEPLAPIDLVLAAPCYFEGKILVPGDTDLSGWSVIFTPIGVVDVLGCTRAPVTVGGHFSLGPMAAGQGEITLRMPKQNVVVFNPLATLTPGTPLLDTVTLQPGETGHGEYAYPGAPLVQVRLALAGAGSDGGPLAASMVRVPVGPAGLAAGPGPEVGPFRLEPGMHQLWAAGSDWVAFVPEVEVPPMGPLAGGPVVPVSLDLMSRDITVTANGVPVAHQKLQFMGAPSSLSLPRLKTDASGSVSLRLGNGSYELYSAGGGSDLDLSLTSAKFDWPLPPGVDELSLKPMFE